MDNKNRNLGREFGEYNDSPEPLKIEDNSVSDGQMMFGERPNEYAEVVKSFEPVELEPEAIIEAKEVDPNVSLLDREEALRNVMEAFNQTNKTYGFIEHIDSGMGSDSYGQYGERVGYVEKNMKKKSNRLYKSIEGQLSVLVDQTGMEQAGRTPEEIYYEKKLIYDGLKKKFGPGRDIDGNLIADSKKRKSFLSAVRSPQTKNEEKLFKKSKVAARKAEKLAAKDAARAAKEEK